MRLEGLHHRAVVYLFQTAPMDASRLDLLQRDAGDLPSDPPKVVKSEIAFGARELNDTAAAP